MHVRSTIPCPGPAGCVRLHTGRAVGARLRRRQRSSCFGTTDGALYVRRSPAARPGTRAALLLLPLPLPLRLLHARPAVLVPLSDNKLSGTLGPAFGSLQQLERVYLMENRLTGACSWGGGGHGAALIDAHMPLRRGRRHVGSHRVSP